MGMPSVELDRARLRAIAASDRPLAPQECAERARLAAGLIEPDRLDRSGPGEAVLLWRDEHSEAWLNLWWQPRDTGYHDHAGSCVGVYVIEGRAWNEPLTIGKPPETREYGPGERPLRPPRRPAAPDPDPARPAIPAQRRTVRGAAPAGIVAFRGPARWSGQGVRLAMFHR